MVARPFVVPVADLLGRPGARRRQRVVSPVEGVSISASRVPATADVVADLVLEWVIEGILASGAVVAAWVGECRRCLGPASGEVRAEVRELFERRPREGESYLLASDSIDLEPMVRDALLLGLPLAPLCSATCAGLCPTCGVNRNHEPCGCATEEGDPRWAALDVLRDEPPGGSD